MKEETRSGYSVEYIKLLTEYLNADKLESFDCCLNAWQAGKESEDFAPEIYDFAYLLAKLIQKAFSEYSYYKPIKTVEEKLYHQPFFNRLIDNIFFDIKLFASDENYQALIDNENIRACIFIICKYWHDPYFASILQTWYYSKNPDDIYEVACFEACCLYMEMPKTDDEAIIQTMQGIIDKLKPGQERKLRMKYGILIYLKSDSDAEQLFNNYKKSA